jgi:AraC family transcriptional regulator
VQDRAWDVLGTVADEVAGRTGVSGAPPACLARLREWVDDDPAAPHRVHQLAASAGVHPVHLSRAFRRHYGITLSEHIRRRRLQHAAALVARGDASLAAAAARAGFADQSHFGRHLRARTGITPSRLRAISQAPRLQTF